MLTKKQTHFGVLIGFILLIQGTLFSEDILLLLSHLTVIFCSWSLAQAKGYKSIWGIISGLFLNVVGYIIILLLPDKLKTEKQNINQQCKDKL